MLRAMEVLAFELFDDAEPGAGQPFVEDTAKLRNEPNGQPVCVELLVTNA
jgi:hypothetical protein